MGHVYDTELSHGYKTRGGYYEESVAWNDSEALAVDLARFVETGEPVLARGPAAYMMVQVNKKTGRVRVMFGRNSGNPLHLARVDGAIVISSENTTHKGTKLEDGSMYIYTVDGKHVKTVDCDVPLYNSTYPGSYYDQYGSYSRGKHGTTYTLGTKSSVVVEPPTDAYQEIEDNIRELEDKLEEYEQLLEIARDVQKEQPHDPLVLDEVREYSAKVRELEDKLGALYTTEV
jgi:hypothetical protein